MQSWKTCAVAFLSQPEGDPRRAQQKREDLPRVMSCHTTVFPRRTYFSLGHKKPLRGIQGAPARARDFALWRESQDTFPTSSTLDARWSGTGYAMKVPQTSYRTGLHQPRRFTFRKTKITLRYFTVWPSLPWRLITHDAGQSVCSNDVAGIENAGICCPEACGACGGSGCRNLPGGQGDCCTSYIASNGVLCSESETAPCIIDDGEIMCTVRVRIPSQPGTNYKVTFY